MFLTARPNKWDSNIFKFYKLWIYILNRTVTFGSQMERMRTLHPTRDTQDSGLCRTYKKKKKKPTVHV